MRVRDWSTRLIALLQERRLMPFEWGKNDCCLFAADAYMALCDKDVASDFRGRYSTELGAYRALKKAGYSTIEDVLTARIGVPKVTALPERGDILLIDNDGQLTVGVHFNAAWVVSENGLLQVPPSWIVKVWSTN